MVQNNGTSFSSPILCGGIASLWQAIPDMSPTEVMSFVRQSASQFTEPDNFLGFGIPDLEFARNLALATEDQFFENFSFYPNPVRTELNIIYPSDINPIEFLIYNQLGQQVLHQLVQDNSQIINVSEFSAGVYFIKLVTEESSMTMKFIKN